MKKDGVNETSPRRRSPRGASSTPTPKLVGLCGKVRTGKSTSAAILGEKMGMKEITFARKIKQICAVLFDWPLEILMADTPETRAAREKLPERTLCGKTYNARQAMEYIGTELFRKHMGADVWVESTMLEIENAMGDGTPVVVSDARFTNEIDALMARGASMVLLHRQPDDLVKVADEHVSNNQFLDRRDHLVAIDNSGDFEDLEDKLLATLGVATSDTE